MKTQRIMKATSRHVSNIVAHRIQACVLTSSDCLAQDEDVCPCRVPPLPNLSSLTVSIPIGGPPYEEEPNLGLLFARQLLESDNLKSDSLESIQVKLHFTHYAGRLYRSLTSERAVQLCDRLEQILLTLPVRSLTFHIVEPEPLKLYRHALWETALRERFPKLTTRCTSTLNCPVRG